MTLQAGRPAPPVTHGRWYATPAVDVAAALGVDPGVGLDATTAAQRLRDVAEVQAYARPGHVVMAASFAVGADGRLSTETRVQPVDADAARAFGRYWWVVRAGSGLIRHDLLRAVRRRAERAAA